MLLALLITGSRDWQYPHIVENAIEEVCTNYKHGRDNVLIIHGDCPMGADRMARYYARNHELTDIPVPAQWRRFGRAAGPIRNQAMVNMTFAYGNRLCLAFIRDHSRGASGTLNMAIKVKIPWAKYESSGNVIAYSDIHHKEVMYNVKHSHDA